MVTDRLRRWEYILSREFAWHNLMPVLVVVGLLTVTPEMGIGQSQPLPDVDEVNKSPDAPVLSESTADESASATARQAPLEHFTPRNTGSNEISDYFVNDLFVSSDGRLFMITESWYQSYIDVYNGNSWEHMDVGSELPNRPTDIAEDSSGTIWVATLSGVYGYNASLSMVDSVNLGVLSNYSRTVTDLGVDGGGKLWIAHERELNRDGSLAKNGGISVYDPGKEELVAYSDTISADISQDLTVGRVQDIQLHSDGNMWVTVSSTDTTAGGIAVFSQSMDSAWTYRTSNGLPSNNAEDMVVDGQGRMWTCFTSSSSDTTIGAAYYDGSQWTAFTESNSPLTNSCKTIGVDSDGQIYYASSDSTMRYDGSSWSEATADIQGSSFIGISDIVVDFNGKTVFAQNEFTESGGIFMKDGSDWSYMSSTTDGGLFSHVTFGTSVDNDGNLWVSGFFGVGHYDGSSWTYYDDDDGLAYVYTWKVHAASNGTVWFGTSKPGISYLQNGDFQTMNKYETFFGESIFEDSKGNIWMGSYGGEKPGILRYDGSSFTRYDTAAGVIAPNVSSFAEDVNGDVIASTYSFAGWFQYAKFDRSEETWSAWNPAPAKIDFFHTEIASGPNNHIWVPGDSLYRWDGTQLDAYDYPGKYGLGARHVEVDPNGDLWLGTNGLYEFDGSEWTLHYEDATFFDISHGSNGNTWGGTYVSGVFKFDHGESTAIEDPKEQPGRIKLAQNYPNPFNPTTQIRFRLDQAADVNLSVYDLLGRKITTLVEGKHQAGQHQATFNAGELSSGVYIYRLKTDDYSRMRKMMLIK